MSQDEIQETAVIESQVEVELREPLSRDEREMMNALSLNVLGRKNAWQKLIRKGELKEEDARTAAGNTVRVKRLHYLSVNDVLLRMKKQISDNETAAAKSAETAALAAGEQNGAEERS